MPVLEDEHEDPEHRAQGEEVHGHGLDGQQDRAGEQEQDQQRRPDHDREHRREVHAEAVLEVDERGGLARDADVDRRRHRTDVADELLGLRRQRAMDGRDRDQRVVPPGGLRTRNGGDVGRPGDRGEPSGIRWGRIGSLVR